MYTTPIVCARASGRLKPVEFIVLLLAPTNSHHKTRRGRAEVTSIGFLITSSYEHQNPTIEGSLKSCIQCFRFWPDQRHRNHCWPSRALCKFDDLVNAFHHPGEKSPQLTVEDPDAIKCCSWGYSCDRPTCQSSTVVYHVHGSLGLVPSECNRTHRTSLAPRRLDASILSPNLI